MSRPKIKIPLSGVDIAMEALGILALILLFVYPAYHYGNLPDTIPTHFNGAGEPDGFSSKGDIWFLPVLAGVTFIPMLVLSRFPHIFNYPTKITEENAERQYRLATKMMRSLNLIIVLTFCYLTFQSFEIALDEAEGLGTVFTPAFLAAIFIPIIIYMVMAFRKPKQSGSSSIDSE